MIALQKTQLREGGELRGAVVWVAVAFVFGCLGSLAGTPVFLAVLGIAAVVIFASLAARFAPEMMAVSVWALALCPFSFGLATGVLPKLFADEVLLLLYLIVLAPLYWFTERRWQAGFPRFFWILGGFVVCQALSLGVGTDLIAFRNAIETFVLGPMLLVVFFQEAANTDQEELVMRSIVWLTIALALMSVLERVVQRNPILEQMELQSGYLYLSPKIVALTEGVYRPYVTFFHPSETGTFMAMGVPFAIRAWSRERTWLASVQVAIIAAGLGVNATRGVWVGVAVSLLLLARHPLRIVVATVPAVGLSGTLVYLALKSMPFMQRLFDLNNLLGRFIYWQLGAQVFDDHKLLGVGNMQFQAVYLSYVQDLSELATISLKQIYVIDNIYLTTLVEHGLVGFAGLIVFFLGAAVTLKELRGRLLLAGLARQATVVRATQLVLVIYSVSGFFADVNQFTKATKLFFILLGFGMGVGIRSLRQADAAEPSCRVQALPHLECA